MQLLRLTALLVFHIVYSIATTQHEGSISTQDRNDNDQNSQQESPSCLAMPPTPTVTPDCTLVMAPSMIPNAGWGVYTLVDRRKGTSVGTGDVVIQVPDLNITHADGMKLMIQDYMWTAEETGGFYEGIKVFSIIAGLGMLANGHNTKFNALPFVPQVDEGGLTRLTSPGAGATTHYHNLTYYARRDIMAGEEILVNYGTGWFQERLKQNKVVDDVGIPVRDVEWLKRHGVCLDNFIAVKSMIPHAGRGVAARRTLVKGSVVAPVPAIPITKTEVMDSARIKTDGTIVETKQLLLNYCLGHAESSLLLFPYSNLVNLINHSPQPNVRLRWSESSTLMPQNITKWSLDEVKNMNRSGVALELVALRDIHRGEEILLEYGESWSQAWQQHVEAWKPVDGAARYSPAYVHDDAIQALRLESELKQHPYPDNIFTSCFYRYSDHAEQVSKNKKANKNAVTAIKWEKSRGIFELNNLRPCNLLQRHQDKKRGTVFTVQIRNRYGLPSEQRLEPGQVHIISNVPRHAIRFSDKIYTTDQHLPNAFRHAIGIPDDIFPKHWKDMSKRDDNNEVM